MLGTLQFSGSVCDCTAVTIGSLCTMPAGAIGSVVGTVCAAHYDQPGHLAGNMVWWLALLSLPLRPSNT